MKASELITTVTKGANKPRGKAMLASIRFPLLTLKHGSTAT